MKTTLVHRVVALAIASTVVAGACTAGRDGTRPSASPVGARPTLPGSLNRIGHEPLFARGMNAGLAVWGDFAYIGSRTDGSPGHPSPGVLVVNVKDPRNPRVVAEIGPPDQGNPGETSRELRVWADQGLLVVLNFACDPFGHACDRQTVTPTIRFYDIRGRRAARPRLISTYQPTREPHEFYLWQDPRDAGRALLYLSTPAPLGENLLVVDISGAREGRFREIATWSASFPDPGLDDALHSLSVSADGRRASLAHLTAGFFVVDTSEVARGENRPAIGTATPLEHRVRWSGVGPHSAVKLPGRDLVLTTDEVYGRAAGGGGCPWGWARLIDIADESAPTVVSEYRVSPYNDPGYCGEVPEERDSMASFSSHNPTVTEHLALVTWHSAGLQMFSTQDPRDPKQLAEFVPEPLETVATEDPLLSSGSDKVVMWSYPIIQNGLIYVVDVRNGLYILDYEGPLQEEVQTIDFLEGNSNLGDAT
jgi:hypothetical protein